MDHDTVEEIKRHFGVVVEDLRSENRALAEGQAEIRREIGAFRTDVTREFEETRSLIRLSYGELDRRVKSLETEVGDLRTRLERLEERLAS
jgi:predicted RNase H-like nuclease (RuvC/YqgF family)